MLVVNLVLTPLVPGGVALVPPQLEVVRELIASILVAQFMLLSFWAAFGIHIGSREIKAILLGCAYLGVAWIATMFVRISFWPELGELLFLLTIGFVFSVVIVAVLTIGLLVVRVKVAELHWLPDSETIDASFAWRFSIRQLFSLILAAALFLGAARIADNISLPVLPLIVLLVLVVLTALVNTMLPIWAILSPGSMWARMLFAILASTFLGFVLSMRTADDDYRQAAMNSLAYLPAAVLLVSALLVVRSCGFRLLPHNAGTRNDPYLSAANSPDT